MVALSADKPVTHFEPRRGMQLFHLIFGIALILQGIVSAVLFLYWADDDHLFTAATVGCAIMPVAAGYWFAGHAWRRLRDKQSAITIGPDGLFDRAISTRPIAWNDIRNLFVWDELPRGGPVVVFDLAEGATERAGVFERVRLSAPLNRPFGYDYRIHSFGTNATIDALCGAIAPYATVKR